MKDKLSAITGSVCIVALMIGIALEPAVYTTSLTEGLLVWATKVVPATLPYFILTRLLARTGCADGVSKVCSPLSKRLYRVSGAGAYVFFTSIVSGYPVGARVTLDLKEAGAIRTGEAARIATFSSTSGPMFILGTVAGLLSSPKAGGIILAAHLLAATLNGLLYRRVGAPEIGSGQTLHPTESDAVYSSMLSMLAVGGYIAFFYVLATFLLRTKLLSPFTAIAEACACAAGLPEGFGTAVTVGLLEMTRGCVGLSAYFAIYPIAVTTACAFLVSAGGLCIGMQGRTYLRRAGVPTGLFALSKLTHAVLSVPIAYGLAKLLL